jgi:pyruvate kinase
MRKTKIVCTLGPATEDKDILKQLFINGMNVARLNFSHGTHEEHKRTVAKFKEIRKELQLPVGLLLDTKGPEVRIKRFKKGTIELEAGQLFTLTSEDLEGDETIVSVTYKNLPRDVNKGDTILIDDGLIELRVLKTTDKKVQCEVINGGTISDRKGINIPEVAINLPYISEKDKKDILFAIENGFDFIAASFVRHAGCIMDIKKILKKNYGDHIEIIAKIENREGLTNIDDIISVSDGIMVARGDMGVEIPFEELPGIQKDIIKKCNLSGKSVITATQMLDSMIRNPRPTRAEIMDVANAIYDGTSAIMLSGETSNGKYPIDALKTMSSIAIEAERKIDYIERFQKTHITVSRNVTSAISHATCSAAHTLGASAIISISKSGHTAKMVSKYRPACPIIANTFSKRVFNQLSIAWGILPIITGIKGSTDEIFDQAIKRVFESGIIENGDLVIITGGTPVGVRGTTNTLKVYIVGDVLVKGIGINNLSTTGNLCVIHESDDSMKYFSAGDILVIPKTTDEILPALKHAGAIITEEDSEDSKAVIAGKALEIPVIANAIDATEILISGTMVRVDASKGYVFSAS